MTTAWADLAAKNAALRKELEEARETWVANARQREDLLRAYEEATRLLQSEREEDRAAIRAMSEVLVLFLHPGDDDCAACVVAKTHAATIRRASGETT